MNNYNTRKHQFENNFENNIKNHNEFNLTHDDMNIVDQRSDDNNIYLVAESTTKTEICPHCKSVSSSVKDKKIVYPLMGTYNGKAIIMKYTKFRFFCYNCNKSFSQPTPTVDKRKQVSNTIFGLIYESLANKNNYTATCKNNHVSISTVIRYFDKLDLNNIRYSKVQNILIDELRLIAYSTKRNIGKFQFAVIDADTGTILDILPDRKQKTVLTYLLDKFSGLELKTVTMDLWNPYKRAVKQFNKETNANVKIIADKFHFVRQLMWDLDGIRISEYDKTTKNSEEYKALKSSANILRKRFKNLSFKQSQRLDKILEMTPNLYVAHKLKEEYLDIVQSVNSKQDFTSQLKEWLRKIQDSPIQTSYFKRTITSHINFLDEISNAFAYEYSNGYIEGMNAHMKLRKKNAYGYRNFERTVKYMKLSVGKRKMI